MNKNRKFNLVSNPAKNLNAHRLYKEVENNALNSCNYGSLLGQAREVLKADPFFDKAYVLQGEIFVSLNRFKDALSSINKALEINASNPKAYAMKAYIYDIQCLKNEALEYCEKALLCNVNDYDLKMSLYDQKLSLLSSLGKLDSVRITLIEASRNISEEDYKYLKECYELPEQKSPLVAIS